MRSRDTTIAPAYHQKLAPNWSRACRRSNRPVTDPSISRSPTSPVSLPMVNPNRCSVSIGSVWPPVGMNASTNNRHDLTVPLRHDDKRNGRREALVQCGNPTNSKYFFAAQYRHRSPWMNGTAAEYSRADLGSLSSRPVFPTVVDIAIRC